MRGVCKRMIVSAVAAVAAGLVGQTARGAAMTPGDVVVLRVGDGSAFGTGGPAAATFVDEYTPTGAFVQSFALPTSGASSLTISNNATTEGLISFSTDGRYLTMAGYRADVGTAGVTAAAASSVPRVVGRMALDGSVDTSTALSNAFGASSVRGAASTDGTQFWVAGTANPSAGNGLFYAPLGATSGTALLDPASTANLRDVQIFDNTLYVTQASSISVVSGGLATTGPQTLTTLTTVGSGGGYGSIAVLDLNGDGTSDTLYAVNNGKSLIEKYALSGSGTAQTATAEGTISQTGLGNALAAVKNADGSVTLFVNTGNNDVLESLTDTSGAGGTLNGTLSALTAAQTNQRMRGIAVVPAAVPEPATVGIAGVAAVGMLLKRRRRQA